MSVQQFCLRWNNHQPNFISVCSSLLHNGTLVDVTLAAEGRQLQAHKIVLSACSSYFQALFTTNPCQHPIVILKDVQYDDLKTMVDFMYYGEVNVSQEQLPHILKTAEMLKIKGLAEMPTDPANLTKSDSKSSTDGNELVGSGERNNVEEQHNSSLDAGNGAGNAGLSLAQMSQMSFGAGGSLAGHSLHAAKLLKESASAELEQQPQDSDLDDGHGHLHMQIKPEVDIGGVNQTMPLDISGGTTPSEHDAPNSQSSHSVGSYATAAQNLSPSESNMVQSVYSQGPTPTQSPAHTGGASAVGAGGAGNAGSAGNGGATGPANQVVKRKRSVNPQGDENFIRALEAVRTGGIGFCKAARLYGVNNRTLWLEYKKRGYPVSRPSIKARVVKQEPNLSPSPTPSTNQGDDNTNETLSMQIPPQAETPTPSLMCTPHHAGLGSGAGSLPGGGNSHPAIGVMSLFDPRYMDSPGNVHSMTRQRYIEATGGGAGAGTGAGTGTINNTISSQAGGTATLLQAAAVMAASGAVESAESQAQSQSQSQSLSISAMPMPVSVPMGMAHSFLINNFVTVAAAPPVTGLQYLDKSPAHAPHAPHPPLAAASSSSGGSGSFERSFSIGGVGSVDCDPDGTPSSPVVMGTKRNRVLTRQPRVKRDSDSISSTNQISPDTAATTLDFDPFNAAGAASSVTARDYSTTGASHHLHHQPTVHGHHGHHHLLAVPPRIERHASEPAPSLGPSTPHLLSVPSSTPYLIKQHSDPLLPRQSALHMAGGSGSGMTATGSNPFAPLHRQYSHPLSGTSSASHVSPAPLHHPHHISLPESIYASGSPPPAGSSQYLVPTRVVTCQTVVSSETAATPTNASPGSSSTVSAAVSVVTSPISGIQLQNTASRHPLSPTFSVASSDVAHERRSPHSPGRSQQVVERAGKIQAEAANGGSRLRNAKSASSGSIGGTHTHLHPGQATTMSSSFEHLPTLRVKNEELQRSVSSPQTQREIITLDNPRSSHCPVIRPGPALGCNFCWNTIDGHGRILRRKTKYHCPECQTNLCIVPCFQEYHERLNNEASSAAGENQVNSSSTTGLGSGSGSGSSGKASPYVATAGNSSHSGGGARPYTKTESI
ncbi:hypothetical protein M5D96_007828 [Drosophila gunungcola]|uniref:Uncharacterized protein n=1 Tax=Drosophila gunungcola TaxID=103775 RepID=A0A9Q0BP83_9MUSC|nr:hypothetical protein M5D96_007828 [Drosophila gunungcola]